MYIRIGNDVHFIVPLKHLGVSTMNDIKDIKGIFIAIDKPNHDECVDKSQFCGSRYTIHDHDVPWYHAMPVSCCERPRHIHDHGFRVYEDCGVKRRTQNETSITLVFPGQCQYTYGRYIVKLEYALKNGDLSLSVNYGVLFELVRGETDNTAGVSVINAGDTKPSDSKDHDYIKDYVVLESAEFAGENIKYYISKNIDLNGKTVAVPANSTIVADGGIISNGELRCNNTTFEGSRQVLAHDVVLSGTVSSALKPELYGITQKLHSSNTGLDNYYALYRLMQSAKHTGQNIDWTTAGTVNIEYPGDNMSIPVPSGIHDFCGTVFNITNKTGNCIFFYCKTWGTKPISVSKSVLNTTDYTSIPELAKGDYLLFVKDNTPWLHRTDSADTSVTYRRDVISIHDGRADNLPQYPYDQESDPTCEYIECNNRTVVKNVIFNLTKDSTYKTSPLVFENLKHPIVENITVNVEDDTIMNQGLGIRIQDCAYCTLRDIVINNTYDAVGAFGYGVYLNNVFNIVIDRLTSNNKNWGLFGTHNVHQTYILNSDISRFDIHAYGKNVSCINCRFKNVYNSYGDVRGNIIYNNCHFYNSTPFLCDASYESYPKRTISIIDCTITTTGTKCGIVTWSKPIDLIKIESTRESNSKKILPDVFVTNLTVNTDQAFYIYYTRILNNDWNSDYFISTNGLFYNNDCRLSLDKNVQGLTKYSSIDDYSEDIDPKDPSADSQYDVYVTCDNFDYSNNDSSVYANALLNSNKYTYKYALANGVNAKISEDNLHVVILSKHDNLQFKYKGLEFPVSKSRCNDIYAYVSANRYNAQNIHLTIEYNKDAVYTGGNDNEKESVFDIIDDGKWMSNGTLDEQLFYTIGTINDGILDLR